MESETALIWADSAVILNAIAAVYSYFAIVIKPWNTEFYNALGLKDKLDDAPLTVLGMSRDGRLKGFKHLKDCLMIF